MIKHNFQFVRGDDYQVRLNLKDSENNPLNLANTSFRLHARDENSELKFKLSTDESTILIIDSAVLLDFKASFTQNIEIKPTDKLKVLNYDLEMKDALNKTTTIMQGKIKLLIDFTLNE